ncbi:hypothetical protein BH11BAC1_BH11BAC1_19520 [soil metagenome]
MNSFLHSTAFFFKRYIFIVLTSVVIGNLIAWKNGDTKDQFYQYVIKVRTRVDYYDLVRTRLEKIALGVTDKADHGIKKVPIESYRNENFYFIEMKLQYGDTVASSQSLAEVIGKIRSDAELKDKYFDLMETYDKLLVEDKLLINEFGSGSENVKEMGFKKSLFELKMYISTLQQGKIKLEEKIQIYFPAEHDYEFVETGNSSKTYLSATVLFFIIGLFIAAVVDRFRN